MSNYCGEKQGWNDDIARLSISHIVRNHACPVAREKSARDRQTCPCVSSAHAKANVALDGSLMPRAPRCDAIQAPAQNRNAEAKPRNAAIG